MTYATTNDRKMAKIAARMVAEGNPKEAVRKAFEARGYDLDRLLRKASEMQECAEFFSKPVGINATAEEIAYPGEGGFGNFIV